MPGNGCNNGAPVSVGQMGGGGCTPSGNTVSGVAYVFVREAPPVSCRDALARGATSSGLYEIDPDGNGPVAPFDVYCDQTTSGGGWMLVGRMGDSRLLPHLDRFLGAIDAPAGTGNVLHSQFAAIRGTDIRVGAMIGLGSNVGTLYQINDCTAGDAACWYGSFIGQNDGDTFGAWITNGGAWGLVPAGCGSDQCPANGGDRDHSQANRIAIFGGDCHSSCSSGGNDVRNGLTFRDYGTADAPSRNGNQSIWGDGTVNAGSTSLGLQISRTDWGQGGTQYRDIWIR